MSQPNVNMSEKKALETFFKNVQQNLKNYSLCEINESLEWMSNNDIYKQKDISMILDVICEDFNIEKETLIYGKTKKELQQARNIAYCILHLDLGVPIRYIAKRIFFLKWHNSVAVAIKYHKSLNVNIAPDRKFKEKMETIQKTISSIKSKK